MFEVECDKNRNRRPGKLYGEVSYFGEEFEVSADCYGSSTHISIRYQDRPVLSEIVSHESFFEKSGGDTEKAEQIFEYGLDNFEDWSLRLEDDEFFYLGPSLYGLE